MKINTDNIQESIQKSRPTLKTNTVKQYEINLNKLKKIFDTDSYDFLEKPKTVLPEEVPTNATGTAVSGTGDDSSTVPVPPKKKKKFMELRKVKKFQGLHY